MSSDVKTAASAASRVPVIFFSHGAGPCFYLDGAGTVFAEVDRNSDTTKWFQGVAAEHNLLGSEIKGIVVVSAHWESDRVIQVQTGEKPDLYFDYYGFPEESYQLEWNAKGDPTLAKRVMDLLEAANFKVAGNDERGYDHGTFVPLKLVFPDPAVPVIQVSILSSLDLATHIKIGAALKPLREEGILIIGSGQATHGRSATNEQAEKFVDWLTEVITDEAKTPEERLTALQNSHKLAPYYKAHHSRADHYMPLLVAAGAADGAAGELMYNKYFLNGMSLASYKFLN